MRCVRKVFTALVTMLALCLAALSQTSLSPATLSFGNQVIDVASSAKTATFLNQQSAPLTIFSIAVEGGTAPSDYTFTTNCPLSPNQLGAAKSCKINVTLTPSALGSRTTTLIVTHSAATSPQSIALSGNGVKPVGLSAVNLSFGTVPVGNTSAAKSVTLTNYQKTTLSFSSISASGDFAIVSNTCGASIGAGATCAVGIKFSPTADGKRSGTLTIDDTATTSPQTVALTGTGSPPLTASPTSLTFGSQSLGTTSTPQTITLTNHLTIPVNVSGAAIIGSFSLQSNTCLPSIGAGSTCTIQVAFVATALGPASGWLKVSFNAYGSPKFVSLSGSGTAAALASIAVTPVNSSASVGTVQQFKATGTYTDSSTQDLTASAAWSSSAPGVASVNSAGLASFLAPGNTNIQAAVGSISGSTSWKVTGGFLGGGNLLTARSLHTSTVLNNGSILTVGGDGSCCSNGTDPLSSAELYNPATASSSATGALNTARESHTATLLSNGTVLLAGGDNGGNALSSAELYDPASGQFTPTGSMGSARESHTATLLPNGYVLIAGGMANGTQLAGAELYNPATGIFAPTGSMNVARYSHTATLLSNGLVLITGGVSSDGPTSSAELYDPVAGTFSLAGAMNVSRAYQTATRLDSGLVLVAGGLSTASVPTASAEIYDPVAGAFTSTGTMSTPRLWPSATLLYSGKVLISGGSTGTQCCILASAELFDPVSGKFEATGGMSQPRVDHTAVLLGAGTVLNLGGVGGGNFNTSNPPLSSPIGSSELYVPDATSPPGLVSIAISGATTLTLGTFEGLVAIGTFSDNSTEQLPCVAWTSSNSTVVQVSNDLTNCGSAYAKAFGYSMVSGCAGSICGSSVLTVPPPSLVSLSVTPSNGSTAVGGSQQFTATGTYTDSSTQDLTSIVQWSSSAPSVATLTPTGVASFVGSGTAYLQASLGSVSGSASWTVTPGFVRTGNLLTPRNLHTATVLNDGSVLIAGGDGSCCAGGTNPLASAELYNPANGSFSATGGLRNARESHTATLLNNGTVLLAGGDYLGSALSTAELYDPASGTFTSTGTMTAAREFHTATTLPNGYILIAGGIANGTPLSSAELYNPVTGTFVATSNMSVARYAHRATLLNNGEVLIAGGGSSAAELYDYTRGVFTPTGNLTVSRSHHTATLMDDGTVLVAGGSDLPAGNLTSLASAEVYDPASGTFTPTGMMNSPRSMHSSTLLTNGKVLVSGGEDFVSGTGSTLSSTELYDPALQTFVLAQNMNWARANQSSNQLSDGSLLVAGGASAGSSSELYKPAMLAPPELVLIAVTAPAPSLSPSRSQKAIAIGTYGDNSTSPLASVIWSSSNPSLAGISNDSSNPGTVLGVAPGTVSITASAGAISGSTSLNVMPAAPEPLGIVSSASTIPCPSGTVLSGGTCYAITTSCPGVQDYTVYLKTFTASPAVGLVMLGTGGVSVGLFESDTYGPVAIQNLLAAGYSVVETSFGGPFTKATVQGWEVNTNGWGLRKAGCRYATVASWVRHNLTPSQPFCVSGNSAGAAIIGYGLTHYGLDQVVNFALLSSGPPFARMDMGCDSLQKPTVEYCSGHLTGMSIGTKNDTNFLDPAYLPVYSAACSTESIDKSTTLDPMFLQDSLANSDANFSYGITVEFMYGGQDTGGSAINQGEFYRNLITSPTMRSCIADAPHTIADALDGAQAIAADLISNCH